MEETPNGGSGELVLLVEDDAATLEVLARRLRTVGDPNRRGPLRVKGGSRAGSHLRPNFSNKQTFA